MRMPLIAAESGLPEWLTGWGTIGLGIATVALVVVTVAGGVYATRVRTHLKISAACDAKREVRVEIFNDGKDVARVQAIDFVARGRWGARTIRRLLSRSSFEPVLSSVTARPAGAQEIAPAASREWRIDVPPLDNWTLPPVLRHPLRIDRRGTIGARNLVLRISFGQNQRPRYLWYKRALPIHRITRVSHRFAG